MTQTGRGFKNNLQAVNKEVSSILLNTGRGYYLLFGLVSLGAVLFYFIPWAYQIYTGQGVTGLNNPSYWGIYLVNFIFWVGVAHAGTLISAFLYITKTPWRRSIHRSAETMTIFALLMAVSFILTHLGRVWNFYWIFPYPNQRLIWTSFQSPLMFDVFAINTYFISSAIFLYFGMIPDMASLRSRLTGWRKRLYTVLSLGWEGTDSQWHYREKAYMLFSVLIMPLVVSVHSIVAWDFALGIIPGLHKTIFAPYFVAGALYSGFAAVVLMVSVLRWAYGIDRYVRKSHYDKIGIMLISLSLLWTYLTGLELIIGLQSGLSSELEHLGYKFLVPRFYVLFAFMIFANSILPLALIMKKIRSSAIYSFLISLFILVGMWVERYLIIVTALPRKYLPYAWHDYHPSWVEISITAGSFFLFTSLFMIFMKVFPIISVTEVSEESGEIRQGGKVNA